MFIIRGRCNEIRLYPVWCSHTMLHRRRLHCYHNNGTLRLCNRRSWYRLHWTRIHGQTERSDIFNGNTHAAAGTAAAETLIEALANPENRGQERNSNQDKENIDEKADTQEEK
jgi:hypothetical protein